MLGALLVAIVAATIVIAVRLYSQLDSAAKLQSTLFAAQQDLDSVADAQLGLQSALRGYLATRDREFLEPFGRGSDAFNSGLDDFAAKVAPVNIPGISTSIAEMRDLHDSWVSQVARPVLRTKSVDEALAHMKLGKVFNDRLTDQFMNVHDLLKAQLDGVESELKRRIDESLYGSLASVLIFGIVSIAYVLTRVAMQDVIERERSIVETLGGAFRSDLDVPRGARVGTAYLSADSDAAVGGDLFDVRRIDERRGLVLVADVSGKGMTAAVNTAFVKYSIRTLARHSDDPAKILAEFNRMFLETVAAPSLFVVGFVGVFDAAGLELTYASAGHSGAFLRRGADVRQLEVTGPIVGLDASFGYESRTIALEAGDLILLATDGLSEARDRAGNLLGDDGAMALFGTVPALDPQRSADDLVDRIRARGGGKLHDDLALLVIALDGEAA